MSPEAGFDSGPLAPVCREPLHDLQQLRRKIGGGSIWDPRPEPFAGLGLRRRLPIPPPVRKRGDEKCMTPSCLNLWSQRRSRPIPAGRLMEGKAGRGWYQSQRQIIRPLMVSLWTKRNWMTYERSGVHIGSAGARNRGNVFGLWAVEVGMAVLIEKCGRCSGSGTVLGGPRNISGRRRCPRCDGCGYESRELDRALSAEWRRANAPVPVGEKLAVKVLWRER